MKPLATGAQRLLELSALGGAARGGPAGGGALAAALRASAPFSASAPAAAAAGAKPPAPPGAAASGAAAGGKAAAPTPGAPPTPGAGVPEPSGGVGGVAGGGGGGGAGRLLAAAAIVAVPAGAYYAYEQRSRSAEPGGAAGANGQQGGGGGALLPARLGEALERARGAAAGALPPALGSLLGGPRGRDALVEQKRRDEEGGFTLLPPGGGGEGGAPAGHAEPAAEAAAAGGGGGASAAQDALSAAADEFPGASPGGKPGAADGGAPRVQHVDMGPIHALFSEVAATAAHGLTRGQGALALRCRCGRELTPAAPARMLRPCLRRPVGHAPASRGRRRRPEASQERADRVVAAMAAVAAATAQPPQQPAQAAPKPAPAPKAAAPKSAPEPKPAPAPAAGGASPASDSELGRLAAQLGLGADVSPSGLIAAANASGLGPYSSSSGTALPAQMAQLNQATADARLLGGVLQQVAAHQAALDAQLAAARQEREWAEAEAAKREASLTEHFKELLREQGRIHTAATAAAVRAAEEALMADTAAAHNEERRLRVAEIDALRAQVNALALAFEQRTAQVKSAHEVHKISLGVLALSRALEEGQPIAQQLQVCAVGGLRGGAAPPAAAPGRSGVVAAPGARARAQDLAIGCPGDPVVAAVASSLPPGAAAAGLPTLQQLQRSFGGVAAAAAEAAYFKGQGEGGVLAHLAAKLAVKLKVDAGGAAPGGGPDGAISRARALLQQGKLLAAADALAEAGGGSQAAAVVQEWVDSARARAVADQAAAYSVFPVTNYKFGPKPPRPEKDAATEQRLARLKAKYDAEGVRRTVDAVLLVAQHNHPHVLLLQFGQTLFFKLPGGKLKPDEDEVSGLRRKLDACLAPEAELLRSPWDVGECVGAWVRPNFDSVLYPYLPPHITRPKEVKKIFVAQLPEATYFGVPKNFNLVAVPLFELYDNATRYGPAIANLPAMLSRLRLNVVAAPAAPLGGAGANGAEAHQQGVPVGGGGGGGYGDEYEGVADAQRRSSAVMA
ncbi:CFIS2 [Scenedesmus sp. PABB004]|nr:CFIS2 [Scenedesmus sp. PABB004]